MTVPTYMSAADEHYFAAIGRLTISWAQIECGLDLTILLLHHDLNGREVEPEIPWSLRRKLRYIRKCFARLKGFKIAVPAINALTAEIDIASEFRHDVVHGFAIDHPEGASQVEMARLLRGKEPYARKKFTVTTTQILQEAVVASKLGGRAMKLAVRLQEIINMAREEPH